MFSNVFQDLLNIIPIYFQDLDSSRVEVGKLTTMLEQERTHCLELEKELQGEGHSQSDVPTQTDHSKLDTPT